MRASTARRNRALHILAHKGRRRFGVCGSDKNGRQMSAVFDVNLLRGGGVVEDGRGKVVLQRNFDTAAHKLLARHFHIVAGVDILYAVGVSACSPERKYVSSVWVLSVRLNTCTMPVESDASLYCHAIQSVSASEKAVRG